MTDRAQAIQRLRDAARRLGDANKELDAAQFELVVAATALDRLDDGDGEEAVKEKP